MKNEQTYQSYKIVSEFIILRIRMYVHKYNHIIVEFQEENRYNINGHKIRLIFGKKLKRIRL